MKELTHIEPFSVANISGVTNIAVGFLIGFMYFLIGLSMPEEAIQEAPFLKYMFGPLAMLVLPIFVGIAGWVSSFIFCLIYNWISGKIGGYRFRLTDV